MPVRISSVGVGSIAGSSTFFPHRPVEEGRSRGPATLAVIANGTSGAVTTANCVTTCERPNLQSGLTVTLTAAGGIYTVVAINAAGLNYREGDIILVPTAAGTPALKLVVGNVSALGAVLTISISVNTTSGGTSAGPLATVPESPNSGPAGFTASVTAAAGVVTAIVPGNSAGRNYRNGDILTVTGVTGATGAVTCSVLTLVG